MDSFSELSLTDLADLAEVTPRTIRYYIAQGLLPPPSGGGPSSRYSAAHRDRLRLIRELQRQHLPLAEIRNRLERLSDEEVAALAETLDRRPAGPPPTSALDYVRAVLSGPSPPWPQAAVGAAAPPRPAPPAAPTPAFRVAPPAAEAAAGPLPAVREVPAGYGVTGTPSPPAASGPLGRSQWERIALAPDIELHVRRPLSRLQNRAVDRLVAIARQLLEEDPS